MSTLDANIHSLPPPHFACLTDVGLGPVTCFGQCLLVEAIQRKAYNWTCSGLISAPLLMVSQGPIRLNIDIQSEY